MSNADDLLRGGDLDGARLALVERVKRAPDDQPSRMFLFQLFCVLSEWDKAKAQLKVLTQLSPEAQMLAVAYNLAINAELEREKVFAGQSPPALLVNTSDWAGDLAIALNAAIQGREGDARQARARAFDAAPDTPGQLGDQPFDWIADADPRFGPAVEAIIAGKWGLLPFDGLEYIRSAGPEDLRDTVWYPVQIGFKSGQSVAGFLPARYPGTETSDDVQATLARATRWVESAMGEAGIGQHVLNLSDGDDRDLLSLRKLEFK